MNTATWPATQVELWPLLRLIPYARNARTHSPQQIQQIAASMREWGWTIPVLADEAGMIIAGHARVQAAELNGAAVTKAKDAGPFGNLNDNANGNAITRICENYLGGRA